MGQKNTSKFAPKIYPVMSKIVFRFQVFGLIPIGIILCFICTWFFYDAGCFLMTFFSIIAGLVFLFLIYISDKSRKSNIVIYPAGIAFQKPNGTQIYLKWNEIVRVREIIGGPGILLDGVSKKGKIKIPHVMKGFDEIREKLFLEREKQIKAQSIPFVFNAFPFRTLVLGSRGLKLRVCFRSIDLLWHQIDDIQWGFTYFLDPLVRFSFVKLTTKDGRAYKLRGWLGKLPEIFITLKKILKRQRSYSFKITRPPIFISEQKLTKNIWLAVLAGAIWITIPGLFMGRVFSLETKTYEFITALIFQYVLLLGSLFFAFRRQALFTCDASHKEKVRPFTASLILIVSFLFGFFLFGVLWSVTGKVVLNRVKCEITNAGYSLEIPKNQPKLPDENNAVFFINKAWKTKSYESLDWQKPNGKKPFFQEKSQFDFLCDFQKEMRTGKISAEKINYARKLLKEQAEILNFLDIAFEKQIFDWGIDYSIMPSYKIEIPEYGGFLTFSRLLVCRAYIQAQDGQQRDALRSLKTGLFLGNITQRTRFVVGEMIGVAVDRIILSGARFVLPRVDLSLAEKEFLSTLNPHELTRNYLNCIQFECFAMKRWMEEKPYHLGFFYRPFISFDLASIYENGLRRLNITELPFSERKSAWERADKGFEREWWWWARLWAGDSIITKMHYRILEALAYYRLTRASVVARKFHEKNKRWPKTVKELDKCHRS